MGSASAPDHASFALALAEARAGQAEGGLPIGAVLAVGERVLGRGRNRRVQLDSAIRHAEMDCLENAGRQPATVYAGSTLYATLSPCHMCSGAIVHFGIPRVVVGGPIDFELPRRLLELNGVEVIVLDDHESLDLIGRFIEERPELWLEDIGVIPGRGGVADRR
jgi:cytosine deaminase